MYCVIQQIERKKFNQYGEHRELEAYSPYSIEGRPKYSYQFTGGRFERPIRTAYKISIHESKRVSGVVTKKQYPVTTVGYYSLIECWIGDYFSEKILEPIAGSLSTSVDKLWELIIAKVDPLQERIKAEYKKTVEYKTFQKHAKILAKYHEAKSSFAKKYSVDTDKYDYCYNIYGDLMNEQYLDEIIEAYQQRQSYSSYHKQNQSNYSHSGSYDYSKLFSSAGSTFTAEEKEQLKRFYKALSMKFHPDMNPATDTTKDMQLLNRLKEDWGI